MRVCVMLCSFFIYSNGNWFSTFKHIQAAIILERRRQTENIPVIDMTLIMHAGYVDVFKLEQTWGLFY